jgi:hypothetical protein
LLIEHETQVVVIVRYSRLQRDGLT